MAPYVGDRVTCRRRAESSAEKWKPRPLIHSLIDHMICSFSWPTSISNEPAARLDMPAALAGEQSRISIRQSASKLFLEKPDKYDEATGRH
jgi:hypothetical protein